MSDYSSNLLRGNTDMLILSLIDELKSSHGYQLIKEMEKRSNGFSALRKGQCISCYASSRVMDIY